MHPAPTALHWFRRPRAWLVSLALGMLVLMQAVGGMHAVLHHGASAADPHDSPFGLHAANSADCQLFDQLAQADLAWLPPSAWTATPPPRAARAPADTPSTPRQARFFRARGPPGSA